MSILGHAECNNIKLISWKVAPCNNMYHVAYFSFSINTKKKEIQLFMKLKIPSSAVCSHKLFYCFFVYCTFPVCVFKRSMRTHT